MLKSAASTNVRPSTAGVKGLGSPSCSHASRISGIRRSARIAAEAGSSTEEQKSQEKPAPGRCSYYTI